MSNPDFGIEYTTENGYQPDLYVFTDEIERVHYFDFVSKLFKQQTQDEMKFHVALGLTGEAGEFADAVKRELIYKKPLDNENVREELGDLAFYLVAAMQVYGMQWNDVLQANFEKLKVRYAGLVYSDKAAQARADKQPLVTNNFPTGNLGG